MEEWSPAWLSIVLIGSAVRLETVKINIAADHKQQGEVGIQVVQVAAATNLYADHDTAQQTERTGWQPAQTGE